MSSTTTRRRAPRALAALAVLAVAGTAATAVPASAATDDWSCWLGSGSACSYDRHTLRSARGSNPQGRTVGAGASTVTSQSGLVGGWAWGGGYACRVLYADQILYPLIKNGSTVTATFYGSSTYGTGAASC
jgi:hypothetical protein